MSLAGTILEAFAESCREFLDDSWILPGARAELGPCQVFGPVYEVEVVRIEHTCDYGRGPFVTHVLVRFESGEEAVVNRASLKRIEA